MPVEMPTETPEQHNVEVPVCDCSEPITGSRRFKHARPYCHQQAKRRRLSEWIIEHTLMIIGLTAVAAVLLVLVFMLKDALPLFFKDRISATTFLFGAVWRPESEVPRFEILALVMGSLMVTVGASIIAIPLGVACAVYLAELAPRWLREILKPTVEMLAAIPSVVMGFIGLAVLNPFLRTSLHLDTGLTALAGAIMLAFMSMPTIISIAEDALSAVPRDYREGALALGTDLVTTIRHIVVPAAKSGLVAACMLGVGRALGETMTVMLVAGNAIQIPLAFMGDKSLAFVQKLQLLISSGFGFFGPARTMTATIASETPDAAVGSTHYHALFAIGALLCLISFVVTLISDMALRRKRC